MHVTVDAQHSDAFRVIAAERTSSQWRENLAMMLANPTAGDTEVIAHLGDETWQKHGAAAAHCCYILAELPVDTHSAAADARMPLLGFDHRNPGTNLDVSALQATELYSFYRARASPELACPSHSPYQLLYAHLLSEVGLSERAAAYASKLQQASPMGVSPLWNDTADVELDALSGKLAASGTPVALPVQPAQPVAVPMHPMPATTSMLHGSTAEPSSLAGGYSSSTVTHAPHTAPELPGMQSTHVGVAPTMSQPPTTPCTPAFGAVPTAPQPSLAANSAPTAEVHSALLQPIPAMSAASVPAAPASTASAPAVPVPAAPASMPAPVPETPQPKSSSSNDESLSNAQSKSSGGMLGGMFSKMREAVTDSVSKFTKKDTQLADQVEFVYNAKYESWIPNNMDPDEWAKENLAAPPPPPTAAKGSSGENGGPGGAGAGDKSAPQTPLGSGPGVGGSAPASGTGRFRSGGSSRRQPARSRYVDTFNPSDSAASTDANLMPPPPARPKPAAPAYKVFTPQRTAANDDGDASASGNSTPLFMTPNVDAQVDAHDSGVPPQ